MTDQILFAVGCAVTFMFLAGAYVAFRASLAPAS